MGLRLHRQKPDSSGGSASPVRQASQGAAIARTLRTGWWPRFLLAGVVLVVVGVTLLSGVTQAAVALLGVLVFIVASLTGMRGQAWNEYRRREPPVPPGSGGGPY